MPREPEQPLILPQWGSEFLTPISPSVFTTAQGFIYIYIYIYIYGMSQGECTRLREGVPYVKLYLYNPKHLCPKLNGYGGNGQRKVWSSGGSTHCTCQLTALSYVTSLSVVSYDGYSAHANDKLRMYFLQGDDVVSHVTPVLGIHVMYSAWNPKDNYDMSASIFVVQFNDFMSLTS